MKQLSRDILVEILRILHRAGFSLYEVDSDYCMQIVAKRRDTKLLIKATINVDNEKRETTEELSSLATIFSASSLIIGSKAQSGPIEDGTLYERLNVNVINLNTFRDTLLYGIFPVAYSRRGGLYFRINGPMLKRLRIERGMSLGEFAAKIGVSRKAVYEYENSEMGATLKTIMKIEEVLNADITREIDIFKWSHKREPPEKSPAGAVAKQLHYKLKKIGCKAIGFSYAPIDVHAKNIGVSFLTDEEKYNQIVLNRKVENAIKVGRLLGVDPVLITHSFSGGNLDIITIPIDEIRKVENVKDLERLLNLDLTEHPAN
ncbi:MAG: transcriptional regulator [Candidatus Methanomethylicaceae archaeon]